MPAPPADWPTAARSCHPVARAKVCFELRAVLRAGAPNARYARGTGLETSDTCPQRRNVAHPPSTTPSGKSRIPGKLAANQVAHSRRHPQPSTDLSEEVVGDGVSCLGKQNVTDTVD